MCNVLKWSKIVKSRHIVSLSLSLVLAGSLAADERLVPKQLSGPIDEIRSGVMAPVAAIDTATHSKSAMIPVDLVQGPDGRWGWQGSVAVDGDRLNMMLFSGGDTWSVKVAGPHTKSLAEAHHLAAVERTALNHGGNAFVGDSYRIAAAQPGHWQVAVAADAPNARRGFLMYSTESPYRLLSYKASNRQLVGDDVSFVTYGYEKTAEGSQIGANLGMVEDAFLRLTTPDGRVVEHAMFDDGLHQDGEAGDGIFGGVFRAAMAGEHTAQVVAMGTTPEGLPFVRTSEHLVPVLEPSLAVTGSFAVADTAGERRLSISLPIDNFDGAPDRYRVFAEVWGRGFDGEMHPVSWIGGMSYADEGRLELGLDTRWIARSAAAWGFELRNVRIEDPDHFITLVELDRMPLAVPSLPSFPVGPRKSLQMDEEMLMGPRPARVAGMKAGRLLLVHGYCSGDAWGPVAGQFTGESIFQDFDKNRSHDTFAQMIGSFGSAWSSFGVVAHSQGGAATLHLYTYYWSGLDYASGSRLIQSVGTPYQGTALAGNAAVLGQIFGAGCGSNYDLTYSGASAWLSGIPTWARGKVNYYTTAFKDNWWSYDYCHLATDLLLNDPDDGTTEKAKGQLSYAVNRGHKSGWCHTTGMAEPPQVRDSSRNSTMNTYAAR